MLFITIFNLNIKITIIIIVSFNIIQCPGTSEQDKQKYSAVGPYYPPTIDYNNNVNYNIGVYYNNVQLELPRQSSGLYYPKIMVCLSIILILVVLIDTIFQFIIKFSPFILIDDVGLLTMAIIYLIFTCKKKPPNHRALGIATVLVWFVGFGIRSFAMTQLIAFENSFVYFIMMGIRSFTMFFCIPFTCFQKGGTI